MFNFYLLSYFGFLLHLFNAFFVFFSNQASQCQQAGMWLDCYNYYVALCHNDKKLRKRAKKISKVYAELGC
jgi:hypothetical protein